MRSLHLTLMIYGQVLLASFILYSAVVSASPLHHKSPQPASPVQAKSADQVAHKPEPEVKLSPSVPVAAGAEQIVESAKVVETISARSLKEPTTVVVAGKSEDAAAAAAVLKEQVVVPKQAPVAPKEPEVKSPAVVESKLEAKSAVGVVPVVNQANKEPHYHVSSSPAGFERVNKPAAVPEAHQSVIEPRSGNVVVPMVTVVESKPVAPELAPAPEPKSAVELAQEPAVKPCARLRNLPDTEAVKSPEAAVVEQPQKQEKEAKVVLDAKSGAKVNEIYQSKVEDPKQEVVPKEVKSYSAAEARKDEKILAERVYREIIGKSQVVMEQQIAPAIVSEQQPIQSAPVKQLAPEPVQQQQAPAVVGAQIEKVVSEPVVGIVEPVKKVEPVSASAMLVVQSPSEPKMIVVSKIVDNNYQQEQHQSPAVQVQQQQVAPTSVVTKVVQEPEVGPVVSSPIVNGGLGPLHLLATTLCSYQPDKPVADDTLNQLYIQRAAVRKSLFDFMSLKFTNLEKFSSRLNAGLEIMPRKTTDPGVVPSHGWPVVGKCTAHDLKLMAEAAWCETSPAQPSVPQTTEALDKETPKITSNHHHLNRVQAARALAEEQAADQSAVISKILHVSDIKDAPIVESSIANLNLTQQQLADIQAQATSTRVCRRNALKLTKSLFNHLAEEQKSVSDSWPRLYNQMAGDDCARKRMIGIVNALSSFRTDSTSIRRDNVEFAFAMDDLRSKVLDSEVNVPLTFDKQFIEVEQFLQQSVKLMLANIDPEKAKLTSMRYRSLMPGPLSADDQCIELHQRLLAKNYPTDCNPTQFGQLPDVLRMAASSLELWSIENELSKRSGKAPAEYPSAGSQTVRQDVNQCIANLVAS